MGSGGRSLLGWGEREWEYIERRAGGRKGDSVEESSNYLIEHCVSLLLLYHQKTDNPPYNTAKQNNK